MQASIIHHINHFLVNTSLLNINYLCVWLWRSSFKIPEKGKPIIFILSIDPKMWDLPKLWTYSLIPLEAKSPYPYIFMDYDTWCHQDCEVHFGLNIDFLNMIFSKLEGLKHDFQFLKTFMKMNQMHLSYTDSTMFLPRRKNYHIDFHKSRL